MILQSSPADPAWPRQYHDPIAVRVQLQGPCAPLAAACIEGDIIQELELSCADACAVPLQGLLAAAEPRLSPAQAAERATAAAAAVTTVTPPAVVTPPAAVTVAAAVPHLAALASTAVSPAVSVTCGSGSCRAGWLQRKAPAVTAWASTAVTPAARVPSAGGSCSAALPLCRMWLAAQTAMPLWTVGPLGCIYGAEDAAVSVMHALVQCCW